MTAIRCLSVLALGFAACSTITVHHTGPLPAQARWALLPVTNQGETPQAGERTEAMLAALLRTERRVEAVSYPPAAEGPLPELDDGRRRERALRWAREGGYDYGLTGSVQEWRYRDTPDGEPAVGLTLEVIELRSGRTVWAATGARAGVGRETLTGAAQKLLRQLIAKMEVR